MKLPAFGIDSKKLVKEGHVILEEVTVVFGHNKANGYISNGVFANYSGPLLTNFLSP
jgi:hypothetical protein